jgi:GTP-binding protein
MFVDQAKILVKAGRGGKGCQSFKKDRWMRHKVADGGDGGRGGNVILKADPNLHTLYDFTFPQKFSAPDGKPGSGNGKKGANAIALIIKVPQGTLVKDAKTGLLLRDLVGKDEEVIVVQGGAGGKGNKHRKEVLPAQDGQEKILRLELKIIADIGIIGLPNAGKSLLLNRLAQTHAKVAAYPFTSKIPILGARQIGEKKIVFAEIPGIIENAHLGKGMGLSFLRHAERTKVLLHLVDMSGQSGEPLANYHLLQKELGLYQKELSRKTQLIVANKMDLELAQENLRHFQQEIKEKVYPVSALTSSGIKDLLNAVLRIL